MNVQLIFAHIEAICISGKNDGSVAGVRYFQCEAKKGVFSRLTRLSRTPLTDQDIEILTSRSSTVGSDSPKTNGTPAASVASGPTTSTTRKVTPASAPAGSTASSTSAVAAKSGSPAPASTPRKASNAAPGI